MYNLFGHKKSWPFHFFNLRSWIIFFLTSSFSAKLRDCISACSSLWKKKTRNGLNHKRTHTCNCTEKNVTSAEITCHLQFEVEICTEKHCILKKFTTDAIGQMILSGYGLQVSLFMVLQRFWRIMPPLFLGCSFTFLVRCSHWHGPSSVTCHKPSYTNCHVYQTNLFVSTLKNDTAWFSKMLVLTDMTSWCQNTHYCNVNAYCCVNFKFLHLHSGL